MGLQVGICRKHLWRVYNLHFLSTILQMVDEKYICIHKLLLIMQTMAIEDSVCGS